MAEIVRFNTNIPVRVCLLREDGKHVEGRYGEQVLYSLIGDRIMYVPPYVETRIRELALGPGEPFEICKGEVRSGDRRWIEWRVKRVEVEVPQQPATLLGIPAAAAVVLTDGQDHRNGSTAGNGKPDANLVGALVPLSANGAFTIVMEAVMHSAAEIAHKVESRAALHNRPLQFNSEDIRAIGLTMFIQATRQGGGLWS